MKKKIVWRLADRPTTGEIIGLLESGLVTKEEAREILFSLEDEVTKKSLESEIKFLRELVVKLSNNQSTKIVEVIKEVYVPWKNKPWYGQYEIWCGGATGNGNYVLNSALAATNAASHSYTDGGSGSTNNAPSFKDIKTF